MEKKLIFIKAEHVKSFNLAGRLESSQERQYFRYICHAPEAECQMAPVVCRVQEKLNTFDEPKWEVDERTCRRCFETHSRALEDLYNAA